MDKYTSVFDMPHQGSADANAALPADRISVRDYVRPADIGAFRSEQGVAQHLRFNVVLEVSHHAAAEFDDVDQVVSYDSIIEAIDHAIDSERVDLLETLSERIASGCLVDPRALKAYVRVEKLDRIPGALGVEIVRTRLSETAERIRAVDGEADQKPDDVQPVVVFLPTSVTSGETSSAWRDAVIKIGKPTVLCLAPDHQVARSESVAKRRIGYLAIEQVAWALADVDPRFEVVESRTELDWALKHGHWPIWAPTKMLVAARQGPATDASEPAVLATWLAHEIDAAELVLVDCDPVAGELDMPMRSLSLDGFDGLSAG